MDTDVQMVEQRTHRRILMEASAGVSLVWRRFSFLSRRPQFRCTTRNVSIRGVQIQTDRLIPPGSILKLWVHSPRTESSELLKLRGEVRWSTPHSSTGLFLSGVLLHGAGGNVALWVESVRSLIRQHFKPSGAEQMA